MSGMPLSISGHTSSSASSAGTILGLNQNPTITTIVGDSGNAAGILQAIGAITQVANTNGSMLNVLNSQSSNPTVSGSIDTPLGSLSTSFNWQTILLVIGAGAALWWFIGRKK